MQDSGDLERLCCRSRRHRRGSLGPKRWVDIASRKQRLANLEEYRKTHKGQLPPVSGYIECCSKMLPCFYKHPHRDLMDVLTDEDDETATSPTGTPGTR